MKLGGSPYEGILNVTSRTIQFCHHYWYVIQKLITFIIDRVTLAGR